MVGQGQPSYAIIKGRRVLVLLDTGANINMITPGCVISWGLPMGPLTDLREEGIMVDQPFDYRSGPISYVIMKVHVDRVFGYNEDQIALVVRSEFAHRIPIIFGTPSTDRVIDKLATP